MLYQDLNAILENLISKTESQGATIKELQGALERGEIKDQAQVKFVQDMLQFKGLFAHGSGMCMAVEDPYPSVGGFDFERKHAFIDNAEERRLFIKNGEHQIESDFEVDGVKSYYRIASAEEFEEALLQAKQNIEADSGIEQ